MRPINHTCHIKILLSMSSVDYSILDKLVFLIDIVKYVCRISNQVINTVFLLFIICVCTSVATISFENFANGSTSGINDIPEPIISQDFPPSPNLNTIQNNSDSLFGSNLTNVTQVDSEILKNISESHLVNLSNNNGSSISPVLYSTQNPEDNNLYVLWSDNSTGNFDVLLKKSSDGGSTFEDTINLSNNNGSSIISTDSSILSDNGNLYIIWIDDTNGRNDIFLKKSSDGGSTFEDTINLSNNNGSSISPVLYSTQNPEDNNLYVLWSDNSTGNFDVLLKKSSDGGSTFEDTINLSNNNGSSISPVLYSTQNPEDNNLYVLWSDNSTGNFDVLLKKSSDGGSTFEDTINLSNNNGSSIISTDSSILSDNGNLYIIWIDDTNGRNDIFLKKSSDGGSTFEDTINLSNNLDSTYLGSSNLLTFSNAPRIKLVNNDILVLWEQHTFNGFSDFTKILAKVKNSTGGVFSSINDLSLTTLNALNPLMISNNNSAYLVWQDNSPIGFDTFNIFVRINTAELNDNFSELIDVSKTRNASINPHAALIANNLAIVWQESTPIGSDEIFFKTISLDKDNMQSDQHSLSVNSIPIPDTA